MDNFRIVGMESYTGIDFYLKNVSSNSSLLQKFHPELGCTDPKNVIPLKTCVSVRIFLLRYPSSTGNCSVPVFRPCLGNKFPESF